MNKVILIGRLTKDPETRYSQSKEPMAITRFSLAVNRRFKKDGEQEADFINCVAFGKTAEFVSKYFSKGKMISIVGNIRTGSYTDNNGQTRYTTDVNVEEVEFCGGKEDTTQNQKTIEQNETFYSIEQGVDDDSLPF